MRREDLKRANRLKALMQVKKERVKYSSWLHKQCQHTLLVYVDFLWRRLPLAEYAKQVEALSY
jgi:hypothetical protein